MINLKIIPNFSILHPSRYEYIIETSFGSKYVATLTDRVLHEYIICGNDKTIEITISGTPYGDFDIWDHVAKIEGNEYMLLKRKCFKINNIEYKMASFFNPEIKEFGIYYNKFELLLSGPVNVRCSDVENIDLAIILSTYVTMLNSNSG